tara:strand:+ start:1479 stop:1820 length:342 start_codon:yes stop_codon:yes gene_type:complete
MYVHDEQAMNSFQDNVLVIELNVSVEQITVGIINDLNSYELPLVCVTLDRFDITADGMLSGIKGSGELNVSSTFFNYINGFWEPLIEPFQIALLFDLALNKVRWNQRIYSNHL